MEETGQKTFEFAGCASALPTVSLPPPLTAFSFLVNLTIYKFIPHLLIRAVFLKKGP
jgi:hypothetical protein